MNASGAIARARGKARDSDSEFFTSDSDLLYIINDDIQNLWSELQFVESTLVYDHITVTTSTGTTASSAEVSLSFTHAGILKDGVWRVGYGGQPLYEVIETDTRLWNTEGATGTVTTGIPVAYYLTQNGSTMGFLWIPNDAYTFNVFYWKPASDLSSVGEALPFGGIFDEYFTQSLTMQMLEIMERDNSRVAVLAQIAKNKGMQKVYARGLRPKKITSNMFSVEGI